MRFVNLIAVCLITSGLVCRSAAAVTNSYSAKVADANWEVTTSRLKCKLMHQVPEYGRVEFMQEAGCDEASLLHLLYGRAVVHTRGQIYFQGPKWQANMPTLRGWKFAIPQSGQPIVFSARQARRMLDAIAQGFCPTIIHTDNNSRTDEVKASISTVRFAPAYSQYLACQANILPVSFEQVRNSAVYFENASVRLDEANELWLGYVLEYAKDPAITRIELSGFTDSVGSFRANHQLASQRVEKVRDYFLQNGIDEKLLRLKVYGITHAAASNNTPEGRAKNRRVAIKVCR